MRENGNSRVGSQVVFEVSVPTVPRTDTPFGLVMWTINVPFLYEVRVEFLLLMRRVSKKMLLICSLFYIPTTNALVNILMTSYWQASPYSWRKWIFNCISFYCKCWVPEVPNRKVGLESWPRLGAVMVAAKVVIVMASAVGHGEW